ncbi:MAG: DUF6263 family protein [Ginsengibacter sp.]
MKKITLFLATALCIATTYAQNTLNLQKGQKYAVENKVTTVSSTEVQGQSMETNVNATTTYNVEVSDVTPTNISLNNTISRMVMNMSMMGQEMNFDSDKKEDLNGQMGSTFKDYIMKTMVVNLDKSGKVIPAKKEDAKEETNPVLKSLGDFETQGFGAQLAFQALPAGLKVGSSWTSDLNTSSTKNTTKYTVTSIAGDLATLAIDGKMSAEMEMEQQGMQMTTKTKGTITGSQVVNMKTGVIQSNTTTVNADGNVEVMGQDLPVTTKTTSTTTVKAI